MLLPALLTCLLKFFFFSSSSLFNFWRRKQATPAYVHRGVGAAVGPEMADSTFQDINPNFQGVPTSALCPSQFHQNFDDHQSGQDLDTDDLFSDPIIWQVCNGTDDFTTAPNSGSFLQHHDFNPMALSVFSVPRAQYNCACCQILRQITHTNGMYVKRLEIHGVFGIIRHALLGIYYDYGSSLQTQDCQMFDFHKESALAVKNFLIQYYEVCRQEGYSSMQDPLSTFYEALSVGYNEHPDNTNDFLQFPPENTGDYNQNEQYNQAGGGSNQVGSMKIPLAMQRERTRNLGINDFVEYFDLPIEEAARKLNICPTVMKKICRKHGILRWPYRKIKSIERKISKSEKILEASADEERARALQDMQNYKQQLNNIYAQFIN